MIYREKVLKKLQYKGDISCLAPGEPVVPLEMLWQVYMMQYVPINVHRDLLLSTSTC